MPVSLTDDELQIIMDGARPLAREDRDAFLHAIAHRLSTCADVGPGSVHRLVREMQKLYFSAPRCRCTGCATLAPLGLMGG